jgi:tyrosine decarboxylase/aspartate 1-decarboxylase
MPGKCSSHSIRSRELTASKSLAPLMSPELDIVFYAVNAADTEPASGAARQLFDPAANKGLHLAIITLPMPLVKQWIGNIDINSENIACLRSVVMRPEYYDWCERLVTLLEESVV